MLLESFDITFTPTSHIPLTQTPVNIELMRNPSWLESISGADFVIVTTDELVTAVTPLKTHRESQGLQTAIVSVEDLYDTFSNGHTTPEAIQSFLQYAVENWTPSPKYGLLIGDATLDHHGYVNKPPMQHVPSFVVPVTFGGETISDAPITDFDGNGRFDLALGRWPVSTTQEVTNLIQRTIAYETKTNLTNATLIVDPAEPSFAQMGERLGGNGRFTPLTTSPLQLESTNWFTAYIGHGSLTQWGQTGILHPNNLPAKMPTHHPSIHLPHWTICTSNPACTNRNNAASSKRPNCNGCCNKPHFITSPRALCPNTHRSFANNKNHSHWRCLPSRSKIAQHNGQSSETRHSKHLHSSWRPYRSYPTTLAMQSVWRGKY